MDILFISNFSYSLDNTLSEVAKHLNRNIKYKILTYRKSNILNSESYENFLEKNFGYIESYSIHEFQNKYKNVNFMRAIVTERFISNYYFGIEKTLGNKSLSYDDMMFFIKSYTLFIEQYIPNTKIVFGGYADNFISTLGYLLSEHFNKKCLAFHPHWIVDNQTCYINEGLGCTPLNNYITKKEVIEDSKKEHIKNYDNKAHFKEYTKKRKDVKKGFLGIISPNILNANMLKFMLFGYENKNQKIRKFLNIDKPSICNKLFANLNRAYNRFILLFAKKFIETNNIKYGLKIFYFPLQIQPEASTSSRAPYFMNQLEIIFNISKSLPLGYILVVKEHPLGYGMRGISFYKKILSLNNVILLNSSISGKDLIQKSELIIGFGGTTLFEAVAFGKKYFLLTNDYIYTDSKLIKSLNNMVNIFYEIEDFLNFEISNEEKEEENNKMINFFYQRGFPLYDKFEKHISIGLEKILELQKNEDSYEKI